jgi:hypothetical protein
MPSEISGLPSLRGYLKLENLVVRLHFPFIDLPARYPAFVERALEHISPKTVVLPFVIEPDETVGESLAPEGLIHTQGRPASPHIAQQPFFQ